jgi:membrane-bound metal-dependent hydrolase YbcI (DUF457 family)
MKKEGHTIGAIAVASLAIYNIDQSVIQHSIMASGIFFGTYLPDLDANHSYIRSKIKILAKLYDLLPQNDLTMHRGALLHSILTLIPFIIFYKNNLMLGIGFGILGHHILDMFSDHGLRYFYPFKPRIRIR